VNASTSRHPEDDAGLTLVELIISLSVGAVLLALVATIFATTMQATAATRDRDLATGRAQAISTSLTTSIRNAAAVSTETLPGGGALARARVATGTATWECRAWAVVDLETTDAAGRRAGSDGRFELRSHAYAPLGSTASVPAPARSWGARADNVEATRDPSTNTPQPFFTLAGTKLSWNLTVAASEQPQLNDRSVAAVAGSAVARAQQDGTASRCW
jgi:prepilin-type N-terminal cleavage/methylation domain-containing protein